MPVTCGSKYDRVSIFFFFIGFRVQSPPTPRLRYHEDDMVSSAVCCRGNDMCMFARDIVQMKLIEDSAAKRGFAD